MDIGLEALDEQRDYYIAMSGLGPSAMSKIGGHRANLVVGGMIIFSILTGLSVLTVVVGKSINIHAFVGMLFFNVVYSSAVVALLLSLGWVRNKWAAPPSSVVLVMLYVTGLMVSRAMGGQAGIGLRSLFGFYLAPFAEWLAILGWLASNQRLYLSIVTILAGIMYACFGIVFGRLLITHKD